MRDKHQLVENPVGGCFGRWGLGSAARMSPQGQRPGEPSQNAWSSASVFLNQLLLRLRPRSSWVRSAKDHVNLCPPETSSEGPGASRPETSPSALPSG